jgi:hypothetical protein
MLKSANIVKQLEISLILSGVAIATALATVSRTDAAVLQVTPENLQYISLQTAGWQDLKSDFKYLPWENCEIGKYCGQDIDAPFKERYGDNFTRLADYKGYYWGQCVSFVKALSKNTAKTREWRRGESVIDAIKSGTITEGTAIATFPRGRYYGHAAFYAGADISPDGKVNYIWLYDQNWIRNKILYHKIDDTGSGPGNLKNYYLIEVPD